MRLAHFQVGRSSEQWVVRFEDRDYVQASRNAAVSVATGLATKVARLGIESVVFIEPVVGETWTEWRPSEPPPPRIPSPRSWTARSRTGEPVPYLRLISG